jgi:hypothetical protein
MPQTRPNKTTVPINSDGYNLTADLATMADSLNLPIKVVSQTERDALTKSNGGLVVRTDLAGAPLNRCDGTNWYGPGSITPATLTLSSGYVAKGSGFATPGVYREGGRVWLVGAATTNVTLTATAGIIYTIATLPAGFAPASGAAVNLPIMIRASTTNMPVGYVQVDSTGAVTYSLATTISGLASGALFFGFDHISWPDS